jgi:hypothetical protein
VPLGKLGFLKDIVIGYGILVPNMSVLDTVIIRFKM